MSGLKIEDDGFIDERPPKRLRRRRNARPHGNHHAAYAKWRIRMYTLNCMYWMMIVKLSKTLGVPVMEARVEFHRDKKFPDEVYESADERIMEFMCLNGFEPEAYNYNSWQLISTRAHRQVSVTTEKIRKRERHRYPPGRFDWNDFRKSCSLEEFVFSFAYEMLPALAGELAAADRHDDLRSLLLDPIYSHAAEAEIKKMREAEERERREEDRRLALPPHLLKIQEEADKAFKWACRVEYPMRDRNFAKALLCVSNGPMHLLVLEPVDDALTQFRIVAAHHPLDVPPKRHIDLLPGADLDLDGLLLIFNEVRHEMPVLRWK